MTATQLPAGLPLSMPLGDGGFLIFTLFNPAIMESVDPYGSIIHCTVGCHILHRHRSCSTDVAEMHRHTATDLDSEHLE